ncbi:MAG: chromosome segregation protein SMC, partial [Verrucomicrobiota bacterium]
IAENERQIRSLSRQASKAKRFQALYDDVKTLELHLSHKQWRELRGEKSELNNSIHGLRLQQDELEDGIEKRQAQMAAARVEYQEIEQRLGELLSHLARLENEIATATNRIEFNGERSHELSVLIRKNEEEAESASAKAVRQQEDIDASDRQLEGIEASIEREQERVASLEASTNEARARREDLVRKIRELEQEKSRLSSRVASLDATIETNRAQSDSDAERLRSLSEESGRLENDRESRSKDASQLRDEISSHQKTIDEFEEKLVEMEQRYHQAKRSASVMQEELSGLHKLHAEKRSRLEVLEQLLREGEGYEEGTRAVLQELGARDRLAGKIRFPLSHRLEVESRFAEAIEAAIGRRLQAVVVSEIETAEEVISALREESLGRALVLAESELLGDPARNNRRAPLGSISWAIDKIECDKDVLPLVSRLLRNVLLAEDLNTALRLRAKHPDFAIATLDGSFVSADGIIEGGRASGEVTSALKMQSEIHDLRNVAETLEREVAMRQERRDQLNKRVDQFEETLQIAREKLQHKRVTSSTLEGKLALVERDLNQLGNKLESLEWEKRDVLDRGEKLADVLSSDLEERNRADQHALELGEAAEATTVELSEAREREESLTEEVTGARTALAVEQGTRANLEEQREPMVSRLSELNESIKQRNEEIQTYRERIERAAEETEQLQQQIEDWKTESESSEVERSTILVEKNSFSDRIEAGEEELTRLRREVQNVADQRGKEEVKSAQLDLGLESLERTCRDRYRTELEFFEPDSHALLLAIEERKRNGAARPSPIPDAEEDESSETEGEPSIDDPAEPDWEFVEEVVTQLRTKLDSMGPVNIDAIEEFDELEEHYRFNVQQLEDLENSKEELLRMIARINRDTRKMFSETFEKIRKNFRDMFKELFGEKAKADLVLMDDSDPLECGIDIIAKPPGKKLQSISLLSGGERSMTAVALLFGIYMVKPSPFCVLDELDAPLDEANINRFIRVLDRFIGDSQFVIVTHSKRTMSRADVMYGVSMEEFGVSKTVGVTFSKADEAKGIREAAVGG